MSIKPVLVPDQDAATLRKLMDAFAEAASGPTKKQLNESRAAVAEAQGVAEAAITSTYDVENKACPVCKQKELTYDQGTNHIRCGNCGSEFSQTSTGKWRKDAEQDVAEARPDVMRHAGDKTVKIVKRRGVPIGEIGIDAGPEGNGQYYVKLYDGSYDASGFDSAEEALAELKYAVKQMSEDVSEGVATVGRLEDIVRDYENQIEDAKRKLSLRNLSDAERTDAKIKIAQFTKFADHYRKKIAQADRRANIKKGVAEGEGMSRAAKGYEKYGREGMQALAAAGREGQALDPIRDKYDRYDESDDSGIAEEGVPYNDPNLSKAYRMGNEAYLAFKNEPARAQAAQDKIEADFPQYAAMWLTGYRDGERFDKEKSVSESIDPIEQLRADIKRFAL